MCTNKCERDFFVSSEKPVVNINIINIVGEPKISQEDTYLLANANSFTWISKGTNVVGKPSKQELKATHSEETSLEDEAVLKNEHDENSLPRRKFEFQCILDQRPSKDVVVYECDVRVDDTISAEEEQDISLKEDTFSLEGLSQSSQIALSEFPADETEQPYYTKHNMGNPNIYSEQKLRELILTDLDFAPVKLCEDLHFQLTSLVMDNLDEAFYPACELATNICLICGQKEFFWDGMIDAPKEPQAVTNMMTRNAIPSYCPQDVTWAGQHQEAVKEAEVDNEQNIIVDWDPQTGRLYLPSFPTKGRKGITENSKYNKPLEEKGFLSRLHERQRAEEVFEGEEEAYLLQVKEQWGLKLQMQA